MWFSLQNSRPFTKLSWLPMQNRLGANLTEFMRHFLGSEGEEVRKSDVYAAIKRLVADAEAASVRVLMTRMERLRPVQQMICRRSGNAPRTERYFDQLRGWTSEACTRSCFPFTRTSRRKQFGIDEFTSSLWILDSFIIRRMVVGVPSNSLSGLFISLCRSNPATDTPSAWLSAALGKEDKNRRWPR